MARRAASGAVEERLPGLRVADENVEDLVEASIRGEVNLRMEKRCQIARLIVRQLKLRHVALGAADAEKRAELLAVLVVLHQFGACEIGTARATPRVGAVTEAALRREQGAASLYRRRVGLRAERLLLLQGSGGRRPTRQRCGSHGH